MTENDCSNYCDHNMAVLCCMGHTLTRAQLRKRRQDFRFPHTCENNTTARLRQTTTKKVTPGADDGPNARMLPSRKLLSMSCSGASKAAAMRSWDVSMAGQSRQWIPVRQSFGTPLKAVVVGRHGDSLVHEGVFGGAVAAREERGV